MRLDKFATHSIDLRLSKKEKDGHMSILRNLILSIVSLAVIVSVSQARADQAKTETTAAEAPDSLQGEKLTAEKRTAIIAKIAEVFEEYYPLPDVAKDMTKFITKKRKNGEYDQFTDVAEFTSQLTTDMRSISNDYHIKVTPYEQLPEDLLAEIKLGSPDDNYGFHKVERLFGNIGYLELTTFCNPKSAGPTAIAAMNFLGHCDALIIDLLINGGGDEGMATFLSSYFFDKSTHLTDTFIRKDDKTDQIWTQEWVPGPKMINVPVYILHSRITYSSSECFSYNLQQLGKAVIIGEKTRGGAYGVTFRSFPELSINLKIPYISEINPYSKTDYVNGVIPDIETTRDKAFIVANIEAAKKLLETETAEDKRFKLEWILGQYEADLNPPVIPDSVLSEYVGTYKNIQITNGCGTIFLSRSNRFRQEMVPMGNDLFKYKDPNEIKYRVQFVRGSDGKITGLYDLDGDGDTYPMKMRDGE
jgi:hypothetical protein